MATARDPGSRDGVEARLSRRQFVKGGAALGGAVLLGGPFLAACGGSDSETRRIVVVGAGLAGLACAYRLHRSGLPVSVYEARPDRVGGRCWTSRDWAEGQVAEHGGEFIDSGHKRIRALAREFDLTLDDLYDAPYPGSSRLWLNGAERSRSEFRSEDAVFQRRIEAAANEVGDYSYDAATNVARAFDEMTVEEWLDENVPDGGSDSLEGRWVWALMASEFGLDADRLSALNLFYQFVERPADADERYHVRGGNDQIVAGVAERLPEGTVRLDAPLEALWRNGEGSYGLRFGDSGRDVIAEHVVLTLPFTSLREVDLTRAGLSARKRACIDELGMGTNAKVLMQFDDRPPAYGDWNGTLTNDDPYYLTWESSLGEPGDSGLITVYLGGRSGAELPTPGPHVGAPEALVDETLGTFSRAGIAGIEKGYNGRAWADRWATDPWVRGSYAAYLPGQYTRFYGFVGKREGNIHFAGEHAATDFQGFLEGAVETGERAATEIARDVGVRAPPGSGVRARVA